MSSRPYHINDVAGDIRRFFSGVPKKKPEDVISSTLQANGKGDRKASSRLAVDEKKSKAKITEERVEISDEEPIASLKTSRSKTRIEPSIDKKLVDRGNRNTRRDNTKRDNTKCDNTKQRDRSVSGDKSVTKKVTRRRRIQILSDDSADGAAESPVKMARALLKSAKKRKKLESSDEECNDVRSTRKRGNSSKKSKTSQKPQIFFDSDSDQEEPYGKEDRCFWPEYPPVVLVSDSDKDTPRKSSPLRPFLRWRERPLLQTDKPSASGKTNVDIEHFFGGGSVKRTDKVAVVASKPTAHKEMTGKKETSSCDSEMMIDDDDDDFALTLQQLDTASPPAGRSKGEPSKPTEGATTADNTSRASRISPNETRLAKPLSDARTSPLKSADKPLVKSASRDPVRSSPRKLPKLTEKTKTPSKSTDGTSFVTKTSPDSTIKTSGSRSKVPAEISAGSSGATPNSAKKGGAGYRSWLHREAPRALGSKPVPQGADNCLEGLVFVITGVLDSFERDEAKVMVEKYGGKVTQSVSRKTDYMVTGRDAGESKTLKAKQFGIKQIDEDGLLALIRDRPGKKSKYQVDAEIQAAKDKKEQEKHARLASVEAPAGSQISRLASDASSDTIGQSGSSLLWVDKYKPNSMKRVIGQQGDKSNGVKLSKWLKEWHRNRALGKKPSGFAWGKDDGSGHRAALLSGPPGIGKTTTAQLVCQECGFSYVELNASDTRSKKTLKEVVAESLDNTTLVDFIGRDVGDKNGRRHCLIMDEVDGVAGTEDRGGIQELIDLIKHTRIPVICICNDRSHQKMRSLVNYCYDLRFYRPRVEQIKGAMMTMLYKEGMTVPPAALNEIILSADQDIRQIINNLSVWCAKDRTLTYEQAKESANEAKKDTKMGPFDVCRRVFADDEETRRMSITDKSDLYFYDYSFGPLFVQENYIKVTPHIPDGSVTKHLSRLARTADSLSDGDVMEKRIRGSNDWSLLPTVAMFASVFPGEYMRGSVSFQIAFPSWLGKNSATSKTDRQLQELTTHMCLKVSSNKDALNRDYLPYLRRSLTQPLIDRESEGVREVIDFMDQYDLVKDDLDSILEVSKWSHCTDPMSLLSTKTKAALTRTYNKESHLTPYAINVAPKKGRGAKTSAGDSYGVLLGEDEVVEASDDEDIDGTAFLVKQKPTKDDGKTSAGPSKAKSKPISSKVSDSKSKGKGRGKGK